MTLDICGAVTEKMPLVAQGRDSWTAEEAAHLARCEACASEWRVLRAATDLGQAAAVRIDPPRLAALVLGEVQRRNRQDRWRRGAGILGLAAAAAVVLVVALQGPGNRPALARGTDAARPPAVQVGLYLPLAELESLDGTQLESVLDGLDTPVSEVEPGLTPSFGDLDETQLERVLRSLEG